MSLTSTISTDRLALARLLTQVENDTEAGRRALAELFPRAGHAHLIGVTGAPGTGKSSLVNQLALYYRKEKKLRVAIVAVDPSSPFTGGAVLGDRVRMRDLSGDPGVFIRSMATRGTIGGLAQASAGIVQVLDAAGFELILIETVGAGQSEVDIARLAHTTLVVEAPGLGDDIQAIKAGILEIADLIIVNKADRPGVESTEKALRSALELAHPTPRVFQHHGQAMKVSERSELPHGIWIPPILRTISVSASPKGAALSSSKGQVTGIAEVADAIERHAAHLRLSGDWAVRERARLRSELEALLRESLVTRFHEAVPEEKYERVLEKVISRDLSPWDAVDQLINGKDGIHPHSPPSPEGRGGHKRKRA